MKSKAMLTLERCPGFVVIFCGKNAAGGMGVQG